MEKLLEMLGDYMEEAEMTEEDKKELEINLKLLNMSLTADDAKINALGWSVDMLAQMEGLTPFELTAACACLISGAVKEQLRVSDKETAVAFYKHTMTSLEETIKIMLEEETNDSKDGDCSCKCE